MELIFQKHRESPLFQAVLKICSLVHRQGGCTLLVGGCVRDALSGTDAKDFDLEVHGLTGEQLKNSLSKDFEMDEVGISFGILKIKHLDIDVSLPRRENKVANGHRGFEVMTDPFLSLEESSARRDFTINAIMYDPLKQVLHDPWHGQSDLKNKVIRHVSDHFSEDPLRVLRAMQFTARFDFSVAPETVEMCSRMRQEELPEDRLAAEWEKMLLKGKTTSRGLTFLRDCSWIRYYPELEELTHQAWDRTLHAMDRTPDFLIGEPREDLLLTLSVLCHQFHTKTEQKTASFIQRIWRKKGIAETVASLVLSYPRAIAMGKENAPDSAYRRLALAAGRLDLLHRVCRCILTGEEKNLDRFLARAKELGVDKQPPAPILLGRHLQERGISPGPNMGRLLALAFEAQLDGVFSDLNGALRWLDAQR